MNARSNHPQRQWRHRQQPRKRLYELAAEVDVSPSFLSMVESGEKQPSLGLALKLSRITGVPVDQYVKAENAA